jgi:hypothetical protein
MAEIKRLTVADAEITDDGAIIIQFNQAFKPNMRRCVFTPEALFEIARDCSFWPGDDMTDFKGIPMVTEDSLYDDEEGEEDEGEGDGVDDAERAPEDAPDHEPPTGQPDNQR